MPAKKVTRRRTRRVLPVWYTGVLDEIVDELFVVANEVHGWTTAEMAQTCELGWSTINKLENRTTRTPQLMTVLKIARASGVDLAELVKALRSKEAPTRQKKVKR